MPLAGPLRNPVYTATNPAVLHPTNGVLLVSRLDGPSEAVARGLVDKALEAETLGCGPRVFRFEEAHGRGHESGRGMDQQRGGDLPPPGF